MNFFGGGRSKSVGSPPGTSSIPPDQLRSPTRGTPPFSPTKEKEKTTIRVTTEKPSGDSNEHIFIPRSDGITQDLLNVLSQPGVADVVNISSAGHESPTPREKLPHEKQLEEGENITIPRTDELTHDIIQVFKAGSDGGADQTLVKVKGRAPSVGKGDLTSMLSSVPPTPHHRTGDSISSANAITIDRSVSSLYYPKSVRIVHFSDTHNFLLKSAKPLSFLPHGNVFVHTGNFTNGGTEHEFLQFNEWLGSVTDLYHFRIVLLGHRDVKVYGNNWDAMKKLLNNATHVLCHEEVNILGIRFYGAPWHWGHKVNYAIRPGAPSSTTGRFDDIPVGIHVLLTHGPAYDRLDTTYGGNSNEHWGSRELADALRKVRPGLHLHGHVKDSRGVYPEFGNLPLTVNSAMVDKDVTVLCEAPHVIRAGQALFDKAKNVVTWTFSIDALDG